MNILRERYIYRRLCIYGVVYIQYVVLSKFVQHAYAWVPLMACLQGATSPPWRGGSRGTT